VPGAWRGAGARAPEGEVAVGCTWRGRVHGHRGEVASGRLPGRRPLGPPGRKKEEVRGKCQPVGEGRGADLGGATEGTTVQGDGGGHAPGPWADNPNPNPNIRGAPTPRRRRNSQGVSQLAAGTWKLLTMQGGLPAGRGCAAERAARSRTRSLRVGSGCLRGCLSGGGGLLRWSLPGSTSWRRGRKFGKSRRGLPVGKGGQLVGVAF
jgi:hypothetical protein